MSNISETIPPHRTILVVEDDELNMKLFRTLLTLDGHKVLEAIDAEKALELVASVPVDLIILDIQLPGMSGIEAVKILKADSSTQNIPAVAVTGYAMSEDRERCMAAGFDDYMTKPLERKAFLDTIHRYLQA